jgi:hypothetical protein
MPSFLIAQNDLNDHDCSCCISGLSITSTRRLINPSLAQFRSFISIIAREPIQVLAVLSSDLQIWLNEILVVCEGSLVSIAF